MGGGAWCAAVHGVSKSRAWLNDFTFTFHFHALEKEMATHSSILAWRFPGTEEPSGLPSMGLHRVRHDWSDLAAADTVLKSRNITLPTMMHIVKAFWSHHFMGNRWGNGGNSVRVYFGGLQNHCRWWLHEIKRNEIKRRLLLGRKVMTNLDSIFKSRDITLPTNVHLVKAMAFPVVMYECKSWTIKKAEYRRMDAFELWCSWESLGLQGDQTSQS